MRIKSYIFSLICTHISVYLKPYLPSKRKGSGFMNRNKTAGVLVGTGLLLLTIAASTFAFNNNTNPIKSSASDYSLTLDSDNGIIGSNVTTNQNVATDSGNYQVAFAYNKCSALNNGHATILAGGSIRNADHILSISSINATFSTSGVLKFRTSYDGSSWGTYSTLTSGIPYSFTSNPYYVEFATDGSASVNLNRVVFTYSCTVNPNAQGLPSEENGFVANDSKKNDYNINDIFDEDNELEVKAVYTDGSEVVLSSNQYSYSVKDSNGTVINTANAFANEGTYFLTVTYKSYAPVQIELAVSGARVIDISLNTDLVRIRVGETAQLTATINPVNATNQAITWSSSNSSVLSVSNTGLATGRAVGTATITATSVDGNHTATCDFYVKAVAGNTTATITPSVRNNVTTNTSVSYSANSFTTNGINIIAGGMQNIYGSGSNNCYLMKAPSANSQGIIALAFDKPYIIRGISINAKYYQRSTYFFFLNDENDEQYYASVSSGRNSNYSVSGLENNTTAFQVVYFYAYCTNSQGGGIYLNSITLTLYDAEARFPTQIVLQDTDVAVGYSKQLEPTFIPADTDMTSLTWMSSNPDVASVNANGVVYGNAVGTATITGSIVNEYGRMIIGSCEVNVHTVTSTAIEIYAANTELSIGQTTQLYSLFTPSETTNKNVTWTSSDPNVATISSSGLVTAVGAGFTVITARAEDSGVTSVLIIEVSSEQLDAYTILLYLCGADLESNDGQATADLTEILSVNCPSNVNFVIQTGGAASWRSTYGISANALGRYHVEGRQLVQDASLEQASMGKYETFRDFLQWGLTTYPAQKTGVIMWNHGGAMQGVCYDENFEDDSLYNSEVVNGVYDARVLAGVSGKLEFIAYDVCLMAVQDIADFNSYNFNYMMASQESESGTGYNYDAWLPTLYNNPANVNTVTLLTKIADTFMAEQGSNNDQTQAVYDLSKMDDYYYAFEALAVKLRSIITSASAWTTFSNLVNTCHKYGHANTTSWNGGYRFDVFDIDEFIDNMQASNNYRTSCSSELLTLRLTFDALVVYETHGTRTSGGGLNLFCAISGYASHIEYDEYETEFTNWRLLNEAYGKWYD